jgi:hypothetical protein
MLSFNIFDIGDVAINTDVEADDGIAFFDSDIEPQKSIFSPASQPKLTERGFAMLYIHANLIGKRGKKMAPRRGNTGKVVIASA